MLISNSYSHRLENYVKPALVLLKTKNMNLFEAKHSSLNEELKEMVEIYLEKHPGLTLNALSSRSGVAATTLRRLMNSSDKKSEMAPHTVLALVSYLLKEKRISVLLNKVEGQIAELLRRSFDQFIFDEQKSQHKIDGNLNTLLQDKTSYLIYKLAANGGGTTTSYIRELFGLDGLTKLSELVEKGQIIADPNNTERMHAREKNFSLDLPLAHKLSHSLIDCYKPNDVNHGLNLFYSLSEGLTPEGIAKIKDIEKNAIKKIFEVMSDNQFRGDVPYFSICVSDVIGPTPMTANNDGVLQ